MTDVTLPQWAQTSCEIIAFILAIASIVALIVVCVWAIMMFIATEDEKRKFVKTLNEHDRALIKYYESINVNPWKRRKQ